MIDHGGKDIVNVSIDSKTLYRKGRLNLHGFSKEGGRLIVGFGRHEGASV